MEMPRDFTVNQGGCMGTPKGMHGDSKGLHGDTKGNPIRPRILLCVAGSQSISGQEWNTPAALCGGLWVTVGAHKG